MPLNFSSADPRQALPLRPVIKATSAPTLSLRAKPPASNLVSAPNAHSSRTASPAYESVTEIELDNLLVENKGPEPRISQSFIDQDKIDAKDHSAEQIPDDDEEDVSEEEEEDDENAAPAPCSRPETRRSIVTSQTEPYAGFQNADSPQSIPHPDRRQSLTSEDTRAIGMSPCRDTWKTANRDYGKTARLSLHRVNIAPSHFPCQLRLRPLASPCSYRTMTTNWSPMLPTMKTHNV